jgi:hypothetical protein
MLRIIAAVCVVASLAGCIDGALLGRAAYDGLWGRAYGYHCPLKTQDASCYSAAGVLQER